MFGVALSSSLFFFMKNSRNMGLLKGFHRIIVLNHLQAIFFLPSQQRFSRKFPLLLCTILVVLASSLTFFGSSYNVLAFSAERVFPSFSPSFSSPPCIVRQASGPVLSECAFISPSSFGFPSFHCFFLSFRYKSKKKKGFPHKLPPIQTLDYSKVVSHGHPPPLEGTHILRILRHRRDKGGREDIW